MNTRLEEGEEDNVLVRVVFFGFSNYISIRRYFLSCQFTILTILQIFHGLWFLYIPKFEFEYGNQVEMAAPPLEPSTVAFIDERLEPCSDIKEAQQCAKWKHLSHKTIQHCNTCSQLDCLQ